MKESNKRTNLVILGIFSVLIGGTINYTYGWATNPPPNNTGAPTDGMCTNCHTGGSAISVSNGISTTIPAEGYTPGQTYSITVGFDLIKTGYGAYGFELSAQDFLGNHVGTMTNNTTASSWGGYMGNNNTATSPTTWTFDWVAPLAGTGSFSFYAASVNGDGDGTEFNDEVLKTSLMINEASATSVGEINDSYKLTANVTANNILNVNFDAKQNGSYTLKVISINGQVVIEENIEVSQGENAFKSVLGNEIKKGIYIVNFMSDTERHQTKISL